MPRRSARLALFAVLAIACLTPRALAQEGDGEGRPHAADDQTETQKGIQALGPPSPKDPSDTDKPPTIYGHDLPVGACRVTGARLVYAGVTDAAPEFPKVPLTLPGEYAAPAPAKAPSPRLGPSVGPIPAAPANAFVGNDFEYHSDVKDGSATHCRSQQFRKFLIVFIDPTTKQIAGMTPDGGEGIGPAAGWKEDIVAPKAGKPDFKQRGYFDHDTKAGTLSTKDLTGAAFTYYQGTPSVIHWIDTPGLTVDKPAANAPAPARRIQVMMAVLRSVTYGAGAERAKGARAAGNA
jgi:hypothetical protein